MHSTKLKAKITWITLFAIAMGFLEAAVVVYLRALYYPTGFVFPLSPMPPQIIGVELIRELTILVMLVCIGMLAGKKPLEKFSWFLFAFGVWDIFYYVGLKLFLNWPPSLFTWDILFLLPVTWVGPVLAPVLCSLMMIGFAILALLAIQKDISNKPGLASWLLIVIGAGVIFISFITDAILLMGRSGIFQHNSKISESNLINIMAQFVPDKFYWFAFGGGAILILAGTFIFYKKVFR